MTLPSSEIKKAANVLGIYPETFQDKHGHDFKAYQLSEDQLIKFATKMYNRGFVEGWDGLDSCL